VFFVENFDVDFFAVLVDVFVDYGTGHCCRTSFQLRVAVQEHVS
jgi:hypothetical protein